LSIIPGIVGIGVTAFLGAKIIDEVGKTTRTTIKATGKKNFKAKAFRSQKRRPAKRPKTFQRLDSFADMYPKRFTVHAFEV